MRSRLLAALVLFAVGCGGSSAPTTLANPALVAPSAPEMFRSEIDHPYLMLRPGMVRIYEGTADGRHRRDEVRVLDEIRVVSGVPCVAEMQEVYLDGELFEVTTEWFAQDREGHVWKFGEQSVEFDGVRFMPTADSWEAGVDAALPWLVLAADPRVGDRYVGNRPDGLDEMLVDALIGVVTVPAGTYDQCLQVVENPDDVEDADIILYAPGTGMISEESSTGRIELTDVRER